MVIEKDTELLKVCSLCGVENWCFPVTSGRPVKGAKSDTNTTDMAPEAELPEESGAIVGVVTETVETVEEAAVPEEKAPKEMPLEAESEAPKNDKITEVLPAEKAKEEEQEDEVHGEGPVSEGLESDSGSETEPEEPDPRAPSIETPVEAEPKPSANDAEIAELEAKLEKLRPNPIK